MAALPPSIVRDAVERLALLGLDRRQATLYVHLVALGPQRASQLAAAVRMHRTDAYRHLQDLMRRGFATASLRRPTTYVAVPPERVWADALAAADARTRELRDARDGAMHAFGLLAPTVNGAAAPLSHRFLRSRQAIYETVEALVRNMRRSQWMVSTTFSAANATPANRPFQTTIEKARAGASMRFLFVESPGLVERIAPMMGPRVEVRFFEPRSPLRFSVFDDEEILYWLVTDPSAGLDAKGDVAMWTNAPDFVRAQKETFEALWAQARPAPTRRAQPSV